MMDFKHQFFRIRDSIRCWWGRLLFDHKATSSPFLVKELHRAVIHRIDGKLGDSVCFAPFIRELKKAAPNIEIVVIIQQHFKEIYEEIPGIDRIVVSSKRPKKDEIKKLAATIGSCDLYVHLFTDLRARDLYFTKYLNPKWVATLDSKLKMDSFSLSSYISDEANKGLHIIDILLKILEKGGISNFDRSYVKFFEKQVLKEQNVEDVVGLVPYGASYRRRLSDAAIIDIISCIYKRTPFIIELSVSPKDRVHISELIEKNFSDDKRIKLCENFSSIKDVYINTAKYKALIGMDTGTAHVMAAYGKPELTIYNGDMGNFNRWHADNPRAVNVMFDCQNLNDISIEKLHESLESFLNNI